MLVAIYQSRHLCIQKDMNRLYFLVVSLLLFIFQHLIRTKLCFPLSGGCMDYEYVDKKYLI